MERFFQDQRQQLQRDRALLADIGTLRHQRDTLEDAELEGAIDAFKFVRDTATYLQHFDDTRRLLGTTSIGLLNIIR